MRKKLMLTLFAVALSCTLTAGVTVANADSVSASKAATPQSYGLYTTDTLVSVMGGKKFTPVNPADGVIKFSGTVHNNGMAADQTWTNEAVARDKDGGPQLNIWSDTAYDFNVGNISSCEGTTEYQMVSNPEVMFEGYTGDFIGEEFLLADTVTVTDYSAISVEVSYGALGNPTPPALQGTDYVGDAFVFAYGKDASGNAKTIQSAMTFGIDYWSTGVVELNPAEIATVERVAVLAATQSIDNQSNRVNSYIMFADFKVHAREEVKEEKSMLVDEAGLDFYNGNSVAGRFGGKLMKVYRANDAYAWNFAIFGGYCYGTQRMAVGSYVTLRLNDPVNVADYKYLDIELYANPVGAEGSWLEETTERYSFSVLRSDANDTQTNTIYEIKKKNWATCRIRLEDFADDNGYVNDLVFYYSDNSSGRTAEEQSKYAILLGIHDAVLTNYEESEVIAYYVESHEITDSNVKMKLKTSYSFAYGEAADEEFMTGVSVNGRTLASLEAENKASVLLNNNYIDITVDRSVFNMDDTDVLEISSGIKVSGSVTVKDKEVFVYYSSLDRFELKADENAEKVSAVPLELVEMGNVDESYDLGASSPSKKVNSIFVTFAAPVCFNSDSGYMGSPMGEMSALCGGADAYVYELAKQGVISSCMDLLYVNGKSIREWIRIDREDGLEGLIHVGFLGNVFNGGKVLRILAAKESNMKIGVGCEMTVEFKAGFVTPRNQYVAKDLFCHISAQDAVKVNSIFDIVDNNEYEIIYAEGNYNAPSGSGCAGALSVGDGALIASAIVGVAAVMIVKRKKED